MPYPSQISHQQIIDTARGMIEAEGVEALSLNRLAAALGVRTPSLYRYVDGRAALLRALNEETTRGLLDALYPTLHGEGPPRERLLALARAYRDYALAHPVAYGLAFTNTLPELAPDPDEMEQGVLPLQALVAELAGPDDSLEALRGLWALIHGFVVLELAGQFRRSGDVAAAFEASVTALLRGWETE